MEKIFTNILKFLGGLCAFLFVLTTGIVLVLFNTEKRLFNASLYISALENQNIYERLPALMADSLAVSPVSSDPNSPRAYLNLLPSENWEMVFRVILPPEVSQPMTEQTIQSVFDYLNGKSETASLSLVSFKTHLTGAAGTESLLAILRAQPACTLEQIAQLTIGSLFGQNTGFVLCNPSDELLNIFQPLLQAQLQTIASTMPDSLDLTPDAAGTNHLLERLRLTRALMRFSPLIPLGFIFLITIFAVRNLKDWLTWWGIPILFGGILGLFLSALIGPLFQWTFALFIAPRLPDLLPTSVTDTIRELLSTVLSTVVSPIFYQSAVLVLIGIVMILSTLLIKKFMLPLEMG
jgi:hypothetical protein